MLLLLLIMIAILIFAGFLKHTKQFHIQCAALIIVSSCIFLWLLGL